MGRNGPSLSSRPDLLAEFDTEKNIPHTPDTLTLQSNRKVWWVCAAYKHSWQSSPSNRYKGRGCPVCSGRIAWSGVNDMATTHPDLAREFDEVKNFPDTPSTIKAGSAKKIWWSCSSHNHSWSATPRGRKQGNGCPVCSGRVALTGLNDMVTTHPSLVQSFDTQKNFPLVPENLKASSDLKLWWLCPKGHSWRSTATNRKNGRGCPVCSGHTTLAGFNDFLTTHPHLGDEFDYNKNRSTSPQTITQGSHIPIWWLCSQKRHSWQAPVYNRTYGDSGCPSCRPESLPEVTLREALGGVKVRLPITGKSGRPTTKEVDIWLEPSHVVVEYDGWYWHKDKTDQDTRITKALISEGYKVVRVRESPLEFLPTADNLHQVKFNPKNESYSRLAEDIKYLISTGRGN